MNPRICTVKHNPPETFGDCVRACIATMIDRDDVPHVFDSRPILTSWSQIRGWLAVHGKSLAIFPVEEHGDFMRENNPGVPYILFCSAFRGGDHAVICKDGEVIHDPAWYRTAINGPHSMGCYVIGIIGDLI